MHAPPYLAVSAFLKWIILLWACVLCVCVRVCVHVHVSLCAELGLARKYSLGPRFPLFSYLWVTALF